MSSPSRYIITCRASNQRRDIDLSPGEFESIKNARVGLMALLQIEEKCDLVFENYVEFEDALNMLAVRNAFFHDGDWSSMMTDLLFINRRLINLLATAILYRDQVKREVSRLLGRERHRQFEARISEEARLSLGYRAMEAVRNHMQHQGLPVSRLSYSQRFEDRPERWTRVTTEPMLCPADLKNGRRVEPSLVIDLQALGGPLDAHVPLKPLVRAYVQALANIHEWLRNDTDATYQVWVKTMDDLLSRSRAWFGADLSGLRIAERTANGRQARLFVIGDEWQRKIAALRNKIRDFSGLARHYTAGVQEADTTLTVT